MRFAVVSIYDKVSAAYISSVGSATFGVALQQAGHEVDYFSIMTWADTLYIDDYDAYLINVNEMNKVLDLVNLIKPTGAKIIVYADGDAERYEYLPLVHAVKAEKIFRMADIIVTNSHADQHYFYTWYGDKVKLIATPVNIDFIVKMFGISEVEPENDLVWQGYISDQRPRHNVLYQIKVAQELGLRSLLTIQGRDKKKAIYVENQLRSMGLVAVEVKIATTADGFIANYLKRCSYAMAFYQRMSLGRTPGECAVMCIPCLGTRNFFQEEFFPELTFDRLCDGISDKLARLIGEKDYRDEIVGYARGRVELYHPDVWYKRFEEMTGI